VGTVLEKVFAADHAKVITELRPTIKKRRQETAQKRFSYMQRVEQKIIAGLEQSSDLRERDLGRYLRGLVTAERG
jgi:hypothetical protein